MISIKLTMKKIHITWLINAAGFLLIVAGCGVIEPEDSQIKDNQPPETVITSGPRANTTNSYFVRIAWKGEDSDGVVQSYNLSVDNGAVASVTKTDSTFVFSVSETNQNTPHTISVAAVDNKGAADPTPSTLTFTATNVAPNAALTIAGNPAPGATFGRGGIFTVVAADPDNGPDFSYRFKIDDGPWSEWQTTPAFEFSINSPRGLLPEGQHTFFAQVRDQALAVDTTPVAFLFVSSASVKPGVTLQPRQNSAPFFEDNSAFSFPTRDSVTFSWSPSFNYAGGTSTGSRYRVDGGAWTEYSTAVSSFKLIDGAPGTHTFEVQYRDLGGAVGEATFTYDLVTATFDKGILVMDDGNGALANRPLGASGDVNADNFYRQVLSGAGVPAQRLTLWDILTQGNLTPKRGFGSYSTVIWQGDEFQFTRLPRQTQLASDYLKLGGKLWIVGWRAVNQIAGTTPVSDFSPANANRPDGSAFIWDFLKLASTRQSPAAPADFVGAVGVASHPNVNVDAAKNFIPSNQSRLSPIDLFEIRPDVTQAQAIYTFVSASGNPNFQGKAIGAKYLGTDFKVVIFGFPLYHMMAAEAIEATRKILQDFGEI